MYNELLHTGQKVYADVVTVGDRKYLSFTGADGKQELISDGDITDEEHDGSSDHESHGMQMYIDHKTELPYVQMICDDKKIKRLIDHEKGNIYDVSDSDQSLSDDDDHG